MCVMACNNICLSLALINAAVWIVTGFLSDNFEECSEGLFQCENTTQCIPQKSNCDGIQDCPDGSDERNCSDPCGSEYYDHLFRKRPSAEHDDFDQKCNLTYEGECLCRSRDIICHYKNYERAPENLPQSPIDLLDFQGNNFEVLSLKTLESLPLEVDTLGLTHCRVSEMEERAFYGISSLRVLRLDNNLLEYFPAGVFPENNSLSVLVVSYNRISRIHEDAFLQLTYLNELDLSENHLIDISQKILEPLENLETLYLKGNFIRKIDDSIFPALPLLTLSLADNKIENIPSGSFELLPSLRSLFLSNNRLKRLVNGTFLNLNELRALTLNDNSIEIIESGVFSDPWHLFSLDLRNNEFRNIQKSVLAPLSRLQHIYFDRFEMCLAAQHVRVCEPRGDGISSQEHLLDNPVLRTSVWVMGAIGCVGNIVVLLGRFLTPTSNVVHSLYIRNLAVSDLLMGVYLFIIAGTDSNYRGVYLQHEFNWRHSSLCSLCGFLSTLSCESSVLILSLVTWDRFVSVTQPLARKQLSPKAAILALLFLWMVAGFVAAIPISNISFKYFGDEFYGSNGVCLSLHIHDPFAMGWEYSAVMFVLVNSVALSFICYAYCRMITEIRASSVACRSTQQSQERDKVAQRFGVIVFTDCACWVPVILVKLAALSGISISKDLYAWLAIFILPINSALNPVLYTLTTTMFKKQMRKAYNSCLNKKKRNEHQNSGFDSGFSLSFGVFPIGGNNRRILSYRGTQSSVTCSKNSWRNPTAV